MRSCTGIMWKDLALIGISKGLRSGHSNQVFPQHPWQTSSLWTSLCAQGHRHGFPQNYPKLLPQTRKPCNSILYSSSFTVGAIHSGMRSFGIPQIPELYINAKEWSVIHFRHQVFTIQSPTFFRLQHCSDHSLNHGNPCHLILASWVSCEVWEHRQL